MIPTKLSHALGIPFLGVDLVLVDVVEYACPRGAVAVPGVLKNRKTFV